MEGRNFLWKVKEKCHLLALDRQGNPHICEFFRAAGLELRLVWTDECVRPYVGCCAAVQYTR